MATADMNEAISRVAAKKTEWACLSPARKLEILDLLLDNLYAHCEELQEASIIKRDGETDTAPAYDALEPHELTALQNSSRSTHWLHSSMLIGNWLVIIREYFEAVVKTGAPPKPVAVREMPTEEGKPQRFLVKVGPQGLLHTTLVTYGSMELMVEGPVEQEMLHEKPPGVSAILGAGNFDGPIDLLTSLFIENRVCVYKVSPYNSLLLDPLNKVFAPLTENGYAAFIYGGPDEGKALLNHPEVDKWKEFLQLIQMCINEINYVGCYYPDFVARMESTKRQLMELGRKPEDFEIQVQCPLSKDTDIKCIIFATDLPEDCFFTQQETFSPCCGEVQLDTDGTIEAFLPVAVKYANEKVHGGLSVSVSVKPITPKEEQAVEQAIADLEYGAVHINTDSKLSIAFPSLIWGGRPGSNIYNLNSGIGFIGNCFGFKRPVKSVVRAPILNFTHMVRQQPTAAATFRSENPAYVLGQHNPIVQSSRNLAFQETRPRMTIDCSGGSRIQ
ncbi:hypothetical protein cyc_01978 [Cyclospora cayetanensis]|uniref:Aldehyde dehydrogenase n=1 Tax=Cyclospora cayetanensis TaxID=88456 RepID=A0A1D3CZL6_9EIME|nr:hypothetical protein cyc_01978 [Cyclospora cayetanensis]